MGMSLEQAIRQKLMISFSGMQPPAEVLQMLRRQPVGGVTLYRDANIQTPEQVLALTGALQQAVREAGEPHLLIGIDQEGGQLMALGDWATPLPGNLALGATRSEDLTYQAGAVLGRELAAMGINVAYAPVCDVNQNPLNPVVGTRSFGENPAEVARLSAAMVRGIQDVGVVATAKHFPGHGDTSTDSHYGAPVIPYDEARLDRVELPPFAAAVEAGVRMVMMGHLVLPALNAGMDLPATLSAAIVRKLLREKLGFQGVIITDAMDMRAIRQGTGLPMDAVAAVAAGVDLLLLKHSLASLEEVSCSLLQATRRALIDEREVMDSAERILRLKQWSSKLEQPSLEVVGCAPHRALALEIASRSVTLVRDTANLLPLHLPPNARLAVFLPTPANLTPADTSSLVAPSLAQALRRYHPEVDEWSLPMNPSDEEVAALRERASGYNLVIIGTINAQQHAGQAALVRSLSESGIPTIAVALRMPYDLRSYPAVQTYICTYSILPPAMEALAMALWGQIPFDGRLPVSIPEV